MKPTAAPRADSPGGMGIESAIRLGGLLFALLVAAATLAHVLSLERTIESEVEGRARTLSRTSGGIGGIADSPRVSARK